MTEHNKPPNGRPLNGCADIAERWSRGEIDAGHDAIIVLGLIGYEVKKDPRLGWVCRPEVERGYWRKLPNFTSADDAAEWLCGEKSEVDDVGMNTDGSWYAGFRHEDYGNYYGNAPTMGGAMWTAFVRLIGMVDDDD